MYICPNHNILYHSFEKYPFDGLIISYKLKNSTCAIGILIMTPNFTDFIILINFRYYFIQNLMNTLNKFVYLC